MRQMLMPESERLNRRDLTWWSFMPGMDGLQIITEFRRRAPMMSILAVSGFRFRDSIDPGQDFLSLAASVGATICLRKPFSPHQLVAAIHANQSPALLAR
jgi:DNA-binding response OmpR family regulator